jgi:hypothetical protein
MTSSHRIYTFFKPRNAVAAALLALVLASPLVAQEASDTYTWSAELLAVDEQAGTITARARLVTEADAAAIAALPAGTRATLVWSGMNWAAGVRRVTRDEPSDDDLLMLPIEVVATEADARYLRFKVAVPKADISKVRSLVEGGWVTAESPRRATAGAAPVISLRPYSDAG